MSNPWISNKVADELFSKHKETLESKKKNKLIEENLKEDRAPEEYKEADKLIEENLKEEKSFEEHKEVDKSPNELKIGSAGRSIIMGKSVSTGAEVSNFLKLPIMRSNPWISNKMVDKLFTKHKKILKRKETDRSIEESVEEERSTEGHKEADSSPPELKRGNVARSVIVKTPFSIGAEVSDFLKLPILNNKEEEEFIFHNETGEMFYELEAKLLATVRHYHEEPYCYLVSSKLLENRLVLEYSNFEGVSYIENDHMRQSIWIPIHKFVSKGRTDNKSINYITTRLPIEIGKYKTEIGLKEKVIFQEKITGIKRISQEVILTDSKFFSPEVKNVKRNPVTVEKGILLVDGYILQRIEYIVACSNEKNTSHKKVYQLMQNMILELVVQIFQEQEVQVESI